jgi:thymidylate kinase
MFNYEKPDLLIYIDTSPELSYERLLKRSRDGELDITLDYMIKLNSIYLQERNNLAKKVVIVDGNRDEYAILDEVLSYFS